MYRLITPLLAMLFLFSCAEAEDEIVVDLPTVEEETTTPSIEDELIDTADAGASAQGVVNWICGDDLPVMSMTTDDGTPMNFAFATDVLPEDLLNMKMTLELICHDNPYLDCTTDGAEEIGPTRVMVKYLPELNEAGLNQLTSVTVQDRM